MEILAFIVLGLISISGWAYAIYINDSWFKDSIKITEDWFNRCLEINDTWCERNIELAKKVDELIAEKNKEEE